MGTGNSQAAAQQLAQQRIVHRSGPYLQPSGIDHHIHQQRLTTGQMDMQTAITSGHDRTHATGLQLPAPIVQPGRNQRGQVRGNAVAVHIPQAHGMAQKTRLVGRGQAGPQLTAQRPDRIEHHLPGQAGGLRRCCLGAQPAHPRAQRHAQQRSAIHRPGQVRGMAQRQQPVARDQLYRAVVAIALQAEQHVDHAQPGPHHQHAGGRVDRTQRRHIPGLHLLQRWNLRGQR